MPERAVVVTERRASLSPVPLIVPAFVALLLAGTAGRAHEKPLWHDEIFTLYLATRTTVSGLWDALASGTDLNPPLYHVAVKGSVAVIGAGPLATRLPALLGYAAASVALFVFMRRRVGVVFALMAAITPSLTGAYAYAYEGRPYGLVLGFCAVALVAWQVRGDGPSHRIAPMACSLMLAAAMATHYYAVLMLLPLVAGELTRSVLRRRIDRAMMLAFVLALTPLILLRPLISGARTFASTFWSPPEPAELVAFYSQLLDPLALLLLCAGCAIALASVWRGTAGGGLPPVRPISMDDRRGLPPEEIVVALALVALPGVGFALGAAVTGAFHGRYVLQGVLGVAILTAWGAATLLRSRRHAMAVAGVLVLAFAARQAGGALGLVRGPVDPMADHRRALSPAAGEDPVVVSHALTFLPMAHYLGRDAARLTYLTRPADVVKQLGVDTGSRALRRLSEIAPISVQDYDAFVARHERFYVYGPASWVIPKLLSQNAEVRVLQDTGDVRLYAVRITR